MNPNEQLFAKAKELYADEEVARHVCDHAIQLGTVNDILDGELFLPHPIDARKYVDRKLGRDNETPSERAAHKRIADLEARIAQLSSPKSN